MKQVGVRSVRPRMVSLALGASVAAIAAGVASPAAAQCSPDPTVANGTTTCSGTDADGLRVPTSGTEVLVGNGAVVTSATAPAITIEGPDTPYFSVPVTLTVEGRVEGLGQAGVSVLSGSGGGYGQDRAAIIVGTAGQVTGASGVTMGRSADAAFAYSLATVDNAGAISGTDGVALRSSNPSYAGFSAITNRATGTIGAIAAPVGRLTNAGTIDGGIRSAIDLGTSYNSFAGSGEITNSGAITNGGTAATLANIRYGGITNGGVISNSGTGAAIASQVGASVANLSGGRITTGGATAITAETLGLVNDGVIQGDVVVTQQRFDFFSGSRIDTSRGVINGDVSLGLGNDTLVARYAGTRALVTGVTGTIEAGAGVNTIEIGFDADASIATPIDLLPGFQRLRIATASGVTTTLADGFVASSAIDLAGEGTLINQASLVTAGPTFTTSWGDAPLRVNNEGSIRTTSAAVSEFALQLGDTGYFTNTGSIESAGAGVEFRSQGGFVNSGTIAAAGDGVSLSGPEFNNAGTIRSTGGTGVTLFGSSGSDWVNAGRIEGVTGASINSALVNTGEINGSSIGVALNAYGVLDNRAGGVVNGGITQTGSFNATVVNAGTINGDVTFPTDATVYSNNNRYLTLPGGVLNGDLTLGWGDLLYTDLNNTGPGRFAGITGAVNADRSTLRYRVGEDASAQLEGVVGFESVGYELVDGAALTLTGTSAQTRPLLLAGQGEVDLTADMATAGVAAIWSAQPTYVPGQISQGNALAITSRGAITLDRTDQFTYPSAAVLLTGNYFGGSSGDSFTNLGTITVRDGAPNAYASIAAISGGASVTNGGSILLDGGVGVTAARAFTNTGSLRQVVGGVAARGVENVERVVNSGVIEVGGTAVLLGYTGFGDGLATLENSGAITSTDGIAVRGLVYGGVIRNLAGGVITGPTAVAADAMTVINAGSIVGTVDMGLAGYGGRSFSSGTYIADGGTVAGDVLFGQAGDLFLSYGETTGVSGRIDGGEGDFDTLGRSLAASGTVSLGFGDAVVGFEQALVEAAGADTVVTVTAETPFAGGLLIAGDGAVVNQAAVEGLVRTDAYFGFGPSPLRTGEDAVLARFTNEGAIGGFRGTVRELVNMGTIGSETQEGEAVSLAGSGDASFINSGAITGADGGAYVEMRDANRVTIVNDGSITGGLSGYAALAGEAPGQLTASNTGEITAAEGFAVDLYLDAFSTGGELGFTNSGLVSSSGAAAVQVTVEGGPDSGFAISNSGRIESSGSGFTETLFAFDPAGYFVERQAFTPGRALSVYGGGGRGGAIRNTGVIAATGADSVAVLTTRTALDLDNSGVIQGGPGSVRTPSGRPATVFDTLPYLAGAVQSLRDFDDRIRNSGTITGSVDLGAGNDRTENRGLIDGAVFLRAGDDRFVQGVGSVLTGVVDGGDGADVIEVDATGGGAIAAERFLNFERLVQSGAGVVSYSGAFSAPTLELSGGGVRVEAGRSFATAGAVTVTGSDASESVEVAGMLGAVMLGGGDDLFAELGEGRATGLVDGGAGVDLYRVTLAGDRAGLSANTGFERLGVDGSGTLSLMLEQGFESVALSGAGIDVRLSGFAIGAVEGGAGAERLTVDGDVARVDLGGGDDAAAIGAATLAGAYDGGAGADVLRLGGAAATLTGEVSGFERIELGDGALTVWGTLGRAGETAAFGDGVQVLEIASRGRALGAFDLGAGDDRFRLAAGGSLDGTVAGGAGEDRATVELAGDATLGTRTLTGFELLTVEGSGRLTLAGGSATFGQTEVAGDLQVASDATLATALRFGGGDNRLAVAGGFAGSVAGGVGVDTIELSGGSAATPIAFSRITEIEAFRVTGGFATIAGAGALGSVDLSGGRLVGLAGSTLTASRFDVGRGATFGSAGTVNGDVAVAGVLSPGASPGTMTVNGGVSLAGTSVSVFEITPTASDRLVVNGAMSIASGATLQLVPTGQLQPGASLDLITASGGITGSFTNVVKPDSLFGFLVQQRDRIQLLGQFRNDLGFGPQVGATIDYANSVLVSGRANAALIAAAPGLVGANGASDANAFALLAPEAYASAGQAAVEQGLTLADAGRGSGFASRRAEPGLFTFGQFAADQRTLRADEARGTARAKFGGYGVFGGLGYAGESWSLGAFAGYLDGRQRLDERGAATDLDGAAFGVHSRAESGAFGLTATAAYAATEADTRRALPGGAARGSYDLTSLTLDVAATYEAAIGSDWALRPRIGGTVVRVRRDAVAETGPAAFAAQVAKERDTAAFIDGALTIASGVTPGATVRPYATLGLRYQVAGRNSLALVGFGGGGLSLLVDGAERARALGTAALGVEADLATSVTLWSAVAAERGEDDRRETVRIGVRIGF